MVVDDGGVDDTIEWRWGSKIAAHGIYRPDQDTAAKFRSARSQAFTTWAEVTGVAMAA